MTQVYATFHQYHTLCTNILRLRKTTGLQSFTHMSTPCAPSVNLGQQDARVTPVTLRDPAEHGEASTADILGAWQNLKRPKVSNCQQLASAAES